MCRSADLPTVRVLYYPWHFANHHSPFVLPPLVSLQKVDPELIFTKQERIGKGSFGEVFKGVDNRTQQVSRENIDKLLLMC